MKKRIISLVLMICLLFTLMPTVVKADVIPGTLDSLRYELYGEEDSPYGIRYGACAVITGCDEAASGKIVIPDKIQGYAVKLIEDNSFRNCHNITEVEIPNNVFYIGDSAFEGCERLSRVRIPNKITKIDLNSFFGTGIWNNEANWLDGVLYIDHVLLAARTSIETCVIRPGTTVIAGDAFNNCQKLREIQIPDGIEVVGYRAFGYCSGLDRINLPNSVKIMDDPFVDCSNLKTFSIPENVESFGWYCFGNCPALKKIYFPKSVKRVGASAFSGTENIEDLYYAGSESEWNDVSFLASGLQYERIHFNHVHTWDDGVITQEPMATTEGSKLCTCTECGAQKVFAVPGATEPVTTFPDVSVGKFYTNAVLWAVSQNPQITSGYADGTFRPDQTCTRAQVATFLWRANGCPEPETAVNPFADVKSTDYYYKAVLWALENNITTGKTSTTFDPTGECTRAQVVTFLWRAKGSPAPTGVSNPFSDVPAGKYYTNAILWALKNNITQGRTATTFGPDDACTRGHVVTFLYRAYAD